MHRSPTNFNATGLCICLAACLIQYAGMGVAAGGMDKAAAEGLPAGRLDAQDPGSPAMQSMRVYRDPQTGRLGPPPHGVMPQELTDRERQMLSRSDQGLRSRTLSGGAIAVDLQGRYRNMAVATVGSNGKAAVNCVVTPRQAALSLRADEQNTEGQKK